MFSVRAARARRFSLLLLEEEEDYVQDWVVLCGWPVDRIGGNWQRAPQVAGRLRLCTRSLFFEPDDVRVPIVRLPFSGIASIASGPALPATAGGTRGRAGAGGGGGGGPSMVVQVSSEVVLMRANAEEVPYTFLRGEAAAASRWAFAPLYAPLQPLLAQAAELLAIHRRPREERNTMLEDLARQRLDRVSFDLSRLVDYCAERPLWCGPAMALTPLVRERGHLAITNSRVYFQPLHNVAGDCPVKSHPLAAIAAVARRRSSLRPIGLELFFIHPHPHPHPHAHGAGHGAGQGQFEAGLRGWGAAAAEAAGTVEVSGPLWDAPSAFFAFRSEQDREAARHILTSQPELGRAVPHRLPSYPSSSPHPSAAPRPSTPSALLAANGLLLEAAGPWLRRVTAAWQRASISNFDYLMYLNFAAGRSFNDLAQWPVFPWVLANYVTPTLDLNDPANYRDLSKPVGALNPSRLEEFRRRFHDMPTDSFEGAVPPFLYGTHYSTPGYVMYWLVRAAPSHMLRLQNGRFDAPDRLFASMREAWEGCLVSSTDVKELIPEFFMGGRGDFLVNAKRLPLGVRQSGRPVDDVELPPWASSPAHFLAVQRAALESPAVSRQLHRWIDLIFGYAQRGPAAEAADNVFFHLTYEGAVDVDAVTSPVELKALETQINEFGQTPKQIFTTPHPPRLVCPPAPDPEALLPPVAAAAAGAQADDLGPLLGDAGDGGSGGTGYGGSGDGGTRDLTLTLLSTIMAAAEAADADSATAAPEPPSASVTAAPPAPGSAGGPSPVPAPPAASNVAVAAAATAAAHSVSAAAAAAAGAAGGAVAGAASLLSGFLKFGRYSQPAASGPGPQLHPQPQLSVPTTPGSSGTAADGALEGLGGAASAHLHLSGAASEPPLGVASIAGSGAASAAAGTPAVGASRDPSMHGNQAAAAAIASGAGSRWAPFGMGRWRRDWGWGARCTRPFATVATATPSRGSLAAVAAGRNGYLYCVGQGGVRVLAEPPTNGGKGGGGGANGLTVVRSAQLDGELLALALLPAASTPGEPGSSAGAKADDASGVLAPRPAVRHPLMLAGSHNRKVYAYAPDVGRVVGCWEAHDDAVCCVALAGTGPAGPGAGAAAATACSLVTSSWDCSVKVWSLAEARAPWSTGLSLPTAELRDFDSGVWALAADPWGGPLLATGTEEGVVALWDLRAAARPASGCAWHAHVADDYVGGLALIADGSGAGAAPAMLLAATADGALSLHDIRGGRGAGGGGQRGAGEGGARGGALCLGTAACGAPLRCCAADGRLALAGDESGAVQLWDVGRVAGGTAAVRQGGPGPDGLYGAWEVAGGGAVCGMDVYPKVAAVGGEGEGGGEQEAWDGEWWGGEGVEVRVAVVTEEGLLAVLRVGGEQAV